jgi:SAM-dependent methyltransferase
MTSVQWLAVFLLGFFFVAYSLWVLVPVFYGLPWVPTKSGRIRKALALAQVRPGEVVYDLGAGDGRVLLIAAREFGARGIGVEISPLHCVLAWLKIYRSGVRGQASIRRENFYTARLSDADVVFIFLTSKQVPRLQAHLQAQLHPGARVVTVSADMDGWQPADCDKENLIFLYHMPPQPGNLESFLAAEGDRD